MPNMTLDQQIVGVRRAVQTLRARKGGPVWLLPSLRKRLRHLLTERKRRMAAACVLEKSECNACFLVCEKRPRSLARPLSVFSGSRLTLINILPEFPTESNCSITFGSRARLPLSIAVPALKD